MKKVLTGHEKMIVATGKGGVGKSTFASQVLVPFLHAHNGGSPVKYIEVDDMNKSATLYENSEIMIGTKIAVSNDLDLSLAMNSDENLVIDVGGNIATEIVIKNIGQNEDFNNLFWIIPLDTGKDSAQNVIKTYSLIKDCYSVADEEPKILFVLNGASDVEEKEIEDLRMEFSFYFGSDWMELDFSVESFLKKEELANHLFFNRFDKIMLSVALKKLAVEIGTADFKAKAKEDKLVKNAIYLEAVEKFEKGEIKENEMEDIKKDRIRSFDVFKSVSKITNYVEKSIVGHYPKLLKFVAK